MGTPRSFKIRLSHTASQAATAAPLYSASVLDSATVGCFLLLQEIAPLSTEKTKPDVDRWSALKPAQSASVRLVDDAVIHRGTDIPEYPLSAIEVKIPWLLHELAKEADRVAEVGSRDG